MIYVESYHLLVVNSFQITSKFGKSSGQSCSLGSLRGWPHRWGLVAKSPVNGEVCPRCPVVLDY